MNRDTLIYHLVNKGKKKSDVARMYGITRQRIGQIWYKEEVNMQNHIRETLLPLFEKKGVHLR